MTENYTLYSELYLSIPAGTQYIIHVNGNLLQTHIQTFIETDGTYTINSLDTTDDNLHDADSLDDLNLYPIQIGLNSYSELDFNVNANYVSPNFIIIENTSSSSQVLTVYLRGNR